MGKSFRTSSLNVEDEDFAVVFSDEMALEIKEGLLFLPEVEREPPRAKEERHV
jgi:hypothetical protein|tara:strand:- start:314 stop:472 length:159 start_codon:yes stop_codon:yes gene_type:complete